MASAPYDLKSHKARATKAWTDKAWWQSIYDEAYDYAIPYRKPAHQRGQGEKRTDKLFDNTAITSTFHGAGQLKEDLFPSGQSWFTLAPGPVSELVARKTGADISIMKRQLDDLTDQVRPYFTTGEFDQATTEFCIDLYAGTGALLPIAGDDQNPVRFVAIPADEIAIDQGPYNDVTGVYWKTLQSRRAIAAAFPKGRFPEEFTKQLNGAGGEDMVELCQDFVKTGERGWKLIVHVDGSEEPVAQEQYRTQPIAVARYHRVPGEAYGRGPILLALPAIKTLNKAQELTLRAAAIRMLGIWAYRPGGAFNPDTARLAPGQFWPVATTGGVLGPDVQRLDTGGGDLQIANLVNQDLRAQIQTALHDEKLPEKGATPISASEVMARMARVKTSYIGAFGRLIHEVIPVVVPRVMEILWRKKLLRTDLRPDTLFVGIKIMSPLATALKADHLQPILQFAQIVAGLQGPQAVERHLKLDDTIEDIGDNLAIPARLRRTKDERKVIDERQAQQAAAQQLAAVAAEAVVKKPELLAAGPDGAMPAQGPA